MNYLALICSLLLCVPAFSCTGMQIRAKDGSRVHGRTLEFGTKLDFSLAVIPRGYHFTGTTPLGKGLVYQAKYGAVGSILFNELAIVDGVNEKGLSVGTFFFPGFAQYAPIDTKNRSAALSPIDFPNWVVTQFASVEEVLAALPSIAIAPVRMKTWGNIAPPFHYIVYDQSGRCIVIEPRGGKLVAHENPLGVMTNSPTFDWHMTNLRNYINLRTNNVAPLNVEGMELAPFGQGSGMVGLPGDFTPPSRFVRAAVFSYTAIPSETAQLSVFQMFHLLNQFDIPIGIAREVSDGQIHTDYTMATCVIDPQSLRYYMKTYEDQTIRMVDLKAFDLDSKKIRKFSLNGEQTVLDVSKLFF